MLDCVHEHAALVMSVQAPPQLAPWKATLTTGGVVSVRSRMPSSSWRVGTRQSVCPAKMAVFRAAATVQRWWRRYRCRRRRCTRRSPVVPPSALAAHRVAAALVGWQYLLVATEQVPDHW